MQDEDTSRAGEGTSDTDEALSRAAREAVRQPADPRLERSFARLGLFTDEDVPAAPPRPGEPVPGPDPRPSPTPARVAPPIGSVAPAVDLEPLHDRLSTLTTAVEAVRASADRLEARLAIITWLAVAAVVAVVVLGILVLVIS